MWWSEVRFANVFTFKASGSSDALNCWVVWRSQDFQHSVGFESSLGKNCKLRLWVQSPTTSDVEAPKFTNVIYPWCQQVTTIPQWIDGDTFSPVSASHRFFFLQVPYPKSWQTVNRRASDFWRWRFFESSLTSAKPSLGCITAKLRSSTAISRWATWNPQTYAFSLPLLEIVNSGKMNISNWFIKSICGTRLIKFRDLFRDVFLRIQPSTSSEVGIVVLLVQASS